MTRTSTTTDIELRAFNPAADMAAAADLMHLAIAEEWLRQLLDNTESPT